MPDVAVGIKGIYRNYGRVIEDFLCADDGTYCIGNPGEGIMKQVFTLDYCADVPGAEAEARRSRASSSTPRSASRNNWQGIASYIYSQLEGNFDGEYAPFTNVGADPNISAAYDYYDFFTNGSDLSRITNTRPAVERPPASIQGLGRLYRRRGSSRSAPPPTGAAARRSPATATPTPTAATSSSSPSAAPRGGRPTTTKPTSTSAIRSPSDRRRVNLLLDVFNVLNTQRAVLLDQRWGFQEADNASPTPVNPGLRKPVLRTPPTSFRLGLRVSF